MLIPPFTSIYHKTPNDRISPSQPSLSCEGQTIVVTGGGRGIGLSIARNFLIAGANVFIVGRTVASLRDAVEELSKVALPGVDTTATNARLGFQAADVSNQNQIRSAFTAAVEKFGKLDTVISNAGYVDDNNPISTSDLDDYWSCYEINVKGGLIVLQEFLKLAKPKATLINITSAASMGVFGTVSAYSSSKLAFVRICEYAQSENPGLRVFNLHPGIIETDMSRKSSNVHADNDISMFLPLYGNCSRLTCFHQIFQARFVSGS
jgi:NAD(P)-dependent dehydrogenase (short-subunit alcohol dehydrogenase family)